MTKLLLFLTVVCVACCAFFAYRWRSAERQLDGTVAYTHSLMDSLGATVEFPRPPYATGVRDSVYWQWVATGAQLKVRKAQEVVRHYARMRQTTLDEADLMMLKQDGLTDPPKQLRESLVSHAELIPYEAVLGGTMAFHEDDIVLLSRGHAFAGFDDGHITGNMLLSYEVKSGQITWKRLWAELL